MIYLRWEVTARSRIQWFDGFGDHPPTAKAAFGPNVPAGRNWNRTVEAVLAHHANTHTGVARAASGLYFQARARMAAHRDTGAAFVGKERRDLDWIVYLEDSGGTNESALSIEYGHLVRGGNKRVGGLFILTGAAGHLAKTKGARWDK